MAFAGTGKIWMNGKLVEWKDATIHIASHVIHYGSGVFEGRQECTTRPKGSAILRLDAHMARLIASAKIYRMECPTRRSSSKRRHRNRSGERLQGVLHPPLMYRGYTALGVNPLPCPVDVAIMVWEWGTYLGADASKRRRRVRQLVEPHGAQHLSVALEDERQLRQRRAHPHGGEANGYSEGIALDTFGFVSEGSGENIFVVRNGAIYTPPLSASILPRHYARHGGAGSAGSRLPGDAGEPSARDAVHRRRSVLRRDRC
jgi:branched-chain amino acid aminotransferase